MLLDPGEGNTAQQSVVTVSQIATVNKSELTDESFIGVISRHRMDQIIAGIRLFL